MRRRIVFQGKEYAATLTANSWRIVDSYGTVPPTSIEARIVKQLGSPENAEATAILAELNRRGVEHLCHFTNVHNIESILGLGILPRRHLERNGIPFKHSDSLRKDGRLSYSSLSISRPNLSMMHSKITDKGRLASWAVFLIAANTLAQDGALFFPSNASSGRYVGEPAEGFQGFESFVKSLPNLGDEFDQEEVMVPFPITPNQLLGIVVPYCPSSQRYDFGDNLRKRGRSFELRRPCGGAIKIWKARFPFFPKSYDY